MAPEREPPTASSSSSSSEEEAGTSSSSQDLEEDQPPKNPPHPSSSEPQPETEEDSDSDNEETDHLASSKPQPPGKRPSETSPSVTAKMAKKEKDGDGARILFQRIFSEEDDIALLEGIVEYAEKTGEPHSKDIDEFYNFIKGSIQAEVTKDQLSDKIRSMKRKYRANLNRGKTRFTKPFDKRVFELSSKVWSDDGLNGRKKVEGVSNVAELGSEVMKLNKRLSEMDDPARRGYELTEASKKKLQIAEVELILKRAELIRDQLRLILAAVKSSPRPSS